MFPREVITKALTTYARRALNPSDYPGFTQASVLILLFPSSHGVSTILTKRTDLVDTHKGQISFPGGMADRTDKDFIHTALREAQEEIGLKLEDVEVLGALDDHAVPSQFLITPVVAYSPHRPSIQPNAVEVAEVFEVPLDFFNSDKDCWSEEREFRGAKHRIWFYSFEGKIIWGATAGMIRNLLSLLKQFP